MKALLIDDERLARKELAGLLEQAMQVGHVPHQVVGHGLDVVARADVGPEAAHGGPIALIRDGDVITIDAIRGEISVDLSDEELGQRKEQWAGPRETIYASGALWKYAQLVGATRLGAVTHPGAKSEKHVYMDL